MTLTNIDAYSVITPQNYDKIRKIFEDAMKVLIMTPNADMEKIKSGIIQMLVFRVGLTPEQGLALYDAEFVTADYSIEDIKPEKKTPI